MKIYVDTNWFLSFFQSNHERHSLLEEVRHRADLIILTEQNVTEYRRNRAALMRELRSNIEKSTRVQPYTTSLLRSFKEHERVIELAQQLRIAADASSIGLCLGILRLPV